MTAIPDARLTEPGPRRATAMRVCFRSVAFSLVLTLLLSAAVPLVAAGRDRNEPRWRDPIDRIVRVVKKFLTVGTNGDGLIPPNP
jgi:hypothetical protein